MAKVGNLALATRLFEEEVGRLDVSVKDVLLVNVRQAHGHTSQVQTDVGEVAKKLPVDVRLNQVIQELKHQDSVTCCDEVVEEVHHKPGALANLQ
jgi:hypothetical protein